MTMYKFDKKNLVYTDVTFKLFTLGIIAIMVLTIISTTFILRNINNVKLISEETKSIIIKENQKENEFSPEKLKAYILQLNIRFPNIVYAQAVLESGNFQSDIFRTNNNLMGMRRATTRPTTNKGEQFDFAVYDNWRSSVEDYAMFAASYLNNIKTEDEYFAYLKANYCTDSGYVDRIKVIIKQQKLYYK